MEEIAGQASLSIAFAAGLISFLSPCILPVMPAYLSLISGLSFEELQKAKDSDTHLRRRVLTTSLAFVVGFSAVFILLGASATLIGQVLQSVRFSLFGWEFGVGQIAGVIVVIMGLHVAGWLPVTALYRSAQVQIQPKAIGIASAFAVGAAFAFGWSPCIGPILGTILTVAASQESVGRGVALLTAYSAGLAVPFLLSGWSIEFLIRTMKGMREYFGILEKVAGCLLIVVGLAMVADIFVLLNIYASDLFGGLSEWILEIEDLLVE